MLKITFIAIGSVKDASIRGAYEEYIRRIGRYVPVEVFEVRESGSGKGRPGPAAMKKEAERILRKAGPRGAVCTVVLEEGGKAYTSSGLAGFIRKRMEGGTRELFFIVGGPYGLHPDVIGAADHSISLSRMTLPHDLARLVLAEQVYRAFTIMRGEPYSH